MHAVRAENERSTATDDDVVVHGRRYRLCCGDGECEMQKDGPHVVWAVRELGQSVPVLYRTANLICCLCRRVWQYGAN
jgi:hypothetical protein